jgi:hypothetical protein
VTLAVLPIAIAAGLVLITIGAVELLSWRDGTVLAVGASITLCITDGLGDDR